jgi:hypothetical protein
MTIALSVRVAIAAVMLAVTAAVAQAQSAVTWVDNRDAVEACLRTSRVERMEDVPVGVTKPKRVFFGADAAVRSAAWKPLLPGRHQGFWESYKSEIAAYELDKLLGMNMVPPAVERTVKGDRGAAVMWVENAKGWDPKATATPPDARAWMRRISRMKMFDQLIANIDRNKGNLLYDADYNLILIDHSRAFTTTTDLKKMAPLTFVDAELWERMKGLTLEQLQTSVGDWIYGKGELQAILKRRDAMQRHIDEMVKVRGESVFLK